MHGVAAIQADGLRPRESTALTGLLDFLDPGLSGPSPAAARPGNTCCERRFTAGECVFHDGAPARLGFRLLSGMVRLFKLLPDGRRQITGFADPGAYIGFSAGTSYATDAEAVDDVLVQQFRLASSGDILARCPDLEPALLECMSSELLAAQQHILLLGRKTSRERLATFLIWRAGKDDMIRLPMSRLDIADYLGMTIETTSRTFSMFRREDLIELAGANVVKLLDRERLADIAECES
ncbi:Nitrogen fixation regulation protein FixK [Rhodovastum atsumiense]|uniref:Helix-turn-helix domain-containing protein n=1 Tax=Rhodovastum atsumiense TaxID=504468 RepID=A0A5M6IXK5_9PROT|nr:helix-turn-helix domain-containing protein [Rhodovastum atsumiense]KAA5613076.1 helix-turn-helix domain-containing protein [Rhodovastum atsumiense]CAH2600062.1 Nitrogen fixation regulation protein FixK [Rhodovastum atsumiense]